VLRARSPFVVCLFASPLAILLCCSSFESGSATTPPALPTPDGSEGREATTAPPIEAGPCNGADVTTDPKNCGRCGRDCGGGTCVAGECSPYRVGACDDKASPFYIAVDQTHVYWTSRTTLNGDDSIHRRLKDDSNALPEKLGAPIGGLFAIALTDTNLFVTATQSNQDGIHLHEKNGGNPLRKKSGNSLDLGISPDGTRAYFMNGGVRWVTTDRTNPDVNTIREGLGTGEGIAVDQTHVYWTVHDMVMSGGGVYRAPINGGPEEPFIPNMPYARRIILDDDSAYVILSSNDGAVGPARSGAVLRNTKLNGGVQTLLNNVNTGRGGIVVDDRYAYLTLEDEGEVARIDKKNGSGLRVLKEGLDKPIGIAQDATSIWFGEAGKGCIWRMVK
jgi:hypothetical protein